MVPHAAYNELCTWISFVLLGIGYSPLFAVAYASLESYFKVSARQTSIIFVFGVIGESIHPPILGYFIDQWTNLFIYYLGSISSLFVIIMFLQPFICDRLFKAHLKE